MHDQDKMAILQIYIEFTFASRPPYFNVENISDGKKLNPIKYDVSKTEGVRVSVVEHAEEARDAGCTCFSCGAC